MGDVKLIGSGFWFADAETIFDTGVAPGADDVFFCNGDDNVVTLDGDVTVQHVTRDSGYGTIDFTGYTMTTTSGSGSYAFYRVKIEDSVGGGKLLVTCAADGTWSIYIYSMFLDLSAASAFEIAPAIDDDSHRIDAIYLNRDTPSGTVYAKGLKIHGIKSIGWINASGSVYLSEIDLYASARWYIIGALIQVDGEVYLRGLFGSYSLCLSAATYMWGHGLILGKDSTGAIDANNAGIRVADAHLELANSILDQAPILIDNSRSGHTCFELRGPGYISPSHLCNDESTPWQDYLNWAGVGTCQKVSSTDPTRRIITNSDVSTTKPFKLQLPPISAQGGDSITLRATVQATVPLECSCALDPDNLNGAQAIETKDAELTETVFEVTGTLDSGDYSTLIPAEFRVREYQVGAYVDLSRVTLTVGTQEFGLDLASWSWYRAGHASDPGTPTGLASLPLHYLRHTVAGSASFQAGVGVGNETQALEHVYAVSAGPRDLPWALVDWGPDFAREKVAGGSRNFFDQAGVLALVFRAAVESSDTDSEAAYRFMNTVGAVVADMEQLAGLPGYLNITGIVLAGGPRRPSEDEVAGAVDDDDDLLIGDFYEVVYGVTFEGQ